MVLFFVLISNLSFSTEVPINIYFENVSDMYIRNIIENRFSNILVKNNSYVDENSPYVLSGNYNITDETITSTRPVLYYSEIEFNIVLGNLITNQKILVFNKTIKGIGKNKDQSIKNTLFNFFKDKNLDKFVKNCKIEILNSYQNNCEFFLQKVKDFENQGDLKKSLLLVNYSPEFEKDCEEVLIKKKTELIIKIKDQECSKILRESESLLLKEEFIQSKLKILSISSGMRCYSKSKDMLNTINLKLCSKYLQESKIEFSKNNFIKSLNLLKNITSELPCFNESNILLEKISKEIDEELKRIYVNEKDQIEKSFELSKLNLEKEIETVKNTSYNYHIISTWY